VTGKKQILIHTLIYGICGGALIVVLKLIEFRFLVIERAVEIYGALIALLFAGLGIWLGLKLTRKPELIVKEVAVPVPSQFVFNEERQRQLGITPRELEILELIAKGLSNREIAEKLFVTENTVKTHSSRVFDKLGSRPMTFQLGHRPRAVAVHDERQPADTPIGHADEALAEWRIVKSRPDR